MTFQPAIDRFVKDKRRYRGFAPTSEVGYRRTLSLLAEQVGNAHPSVVSRCDCMVVLERWHGETLRTNRAQMISFFRWAMGEGICETNPAEQTPQVRRRSNPRYRLNYAEMEAMLDAAETVLEWRCIGLGLLVGFRSKELGGLQGRHFRRDGLIEVTAKMGKGGKARWVAVVPGLLAVVSEIRENVGAEEYVFPARRPANPPKNTVWESVRLRPMSQQALGSLVERVAKRASVPGRVTAHCLRHANAQVMAEYAGIYIASAQLGHGDLRTTQGYLSAPTADRQMEAVRRVNLRTSVRFTPLIPSKATTGIEPV